MSFHAHERYQMHCRFCFLRFEGDSVSEVLLAVATHEGERHVPAQRTPAKEVIDEGKIERT